MRLVERKRGRRCRPRPAARPLGAAQPRPFQRRQHDRAGHVPCRARCGRWRPRTGRRDRRHARRSPSPTALVRFLQHEQPGFRLDRADDLGQARPQRRIRAVHVASPHRRSGRYPSSGSGPSPSSTGRVVERQPHHQRFVEARPSLRRRDGREIAGAGQRRQAEGQRPAIGVEAALGRARCAPRCRGRRRDRAD